MISCLLPSTEKPFQKDGNISDRRMGIWSKFGKYLYIGMAVLYLFFLFIYFAVCFVRGLDTSS